MKNNNLNKLFSYPSFFCFAISALTYACFAVRKEVDNYFCFKILIFVFVFFLNVFYLRCQDENITDIISSIAEELADDESDPEAAGIYIEKLHALNEDPVALNSADESELSRIFFLTDFQIKTIADHIQSSGKILSVYEIAAIPGFNRELAELIIPFISLESDKPEPDKTARVNNNLLTNLSVRYPVSDAEHVGSPWKSLTRYKISSGKLSAGFTAEKDGGEKFFSGKPALPDFLSANLYWNGNRMFRKIIIGDYGARFGMGTVINTNMRIGLSLTQTGYLSGGDEIKPYTSTDENNFFRGAALQLKFKKTGISVFCSLNRIDANIDTAENWSDLYIRTFQKSGLHSTLSSLAGKDAVRESIYGINLVSDFNNLRIGFLWSGSQLSIPVKTDRDDPSEIFDFEGTNNNMLAIYYKALFGRIVIFGETAADINKRLAMVHGVTFRPSDRLNINFLYRDYSPGFTSFHGKGPFSSSAGDNTKGLFGNFTFEAARYLFIAAGCNISYSPWLKYRCSSGSVTINRELRIKYIPSEKLTLEAQYNYRSSMYDSQEISGIKKQATVENRIFKGRVRYWPGDNLSLTTRLDFKISKPGSLKGMLLLQDVNYNIPEIPVSIWLRYCLYKTEGWESRLYVYENDLSYSFSVPVLSGTGCRSCIMVTWKAGRSFYLRIKYGLNEIWEDYEISKETREFRMQLRFFF